MFVGWFLVFFFNTTSGLGMHSLVSLRGRGGGGFFSSASNRKSNFKIIDVKPPKQIARIAPELQQPGPIFKVSKANWYLAVSEAGWEAREETLPDGVPCIHMLAARIRAGTFPPALANPVPQHPNRLALFTAIVFWAFFSITAP